MHIVVANPRRFCAGVERAILIVERAPEGFGEPVHVRHEILHNRHVVESLRARGAIFLHQLEDIAQGSLVIFSAHGVSRAVADPAKLACATRNRQSAARELARRAQLVIVPGAPRSSNSLRLEELVGQRGQRGRPIRRFEHGVQAAARTAARRQAGAHGTSGPRLARGSDIRREKPRMKDLA